MRRTNDAIKFIVFEKIVKRDERLEMMDLRRFII